MRRQRAQGAGDERLRPLAKLEAQLSQPDRPPHIFVHEADQTNFLHTSFPCRSFERRRSGSRNFIARPALWGQQQSGLMVPPCYNPHSALLFGVKGDRVRIEGSCHRREEGGFPTHP